MNKPLAWNGAPRRGLIEIETMSGKSTKIVSSRHAQASGAAALLRNEIYTHKIHTYIEFDLECTSSDRVNA